jgi:hypothetical protein
MDHHFKLFQLFLFKINTLSLWNLKALTLIRYRKMSIH